MGNLASLLKDKPLAEIVVDFERADPSEDDREIYDAVQLRVGRAEEVLASLTALGDDIAILKKAQERVEGATPNTTRDELEGPWNDLCGMAQVLANVFVYCREELRANSVSLLLPKLATDTPLETFQAHQALVNQLAHVFDFAIRFDSLRSTHMVPLSNFFASCKRREGKMADMGLGCPVESTQAMHMTLFFSDPTPMLKELIQEVLTLLNNEVDEAESCEQMREVLVLLAESCLYMATKGAFDRAGTKEFVTRVMAVTIIIYDHVSAEGAFKGRIPMKQAIKAIQDLENAQTRVLLLSALMHATKTSRSAPANIISMLQG